MPGQVFSPMISRSLSSKDCKKAVVPKANEADKEVSMFLRMVTHAAQVDKVVQMVETYDRRIIGSFRSTPGCVFASLLQNINAPSECISLTIWQSQQFAMDYEKGGLFKELVESLRPYFVESNEWKLELTEELSLDYTPIQSEPTVSRFNDSVAGSEEITKLKSKPFAIQILSLTVQEEENHKFEEIFMQDIHPKYKAHKGFIDLILLRQKREYYIFSFWDEAVDLQSPSGIHSIGHLLDSIYTVLPSFIQWRTKHRSAARISASSEEFKATVHRCLTAEWFIR